MAKDETEIGITGLPIPKKKRSPAKQHKFEKKRRENLGSNVGGVPIRRDVNPNYNPRQRTFEEFMMIVEAKIDKKLPEHERSGARLARYDNPSGALALGGGQQRSRRAEHEERRGKKK